MLLEAWGSIPEIYKRGGEGHLETSWILDLCIVFVERFENSVLDFSSSPRMETLG